MNRLMKFFKYDHLPEGPMRDTSKSYCEFAEKVDKSIPEGPEKTAGLRKLLESKDCAVRACLPD